MVVLLPWKRGPGNSFHLASSLASFPLPSPWFGSDRTLCLGSLDFPFPPPFPLDGLTFRVRLFRSRLLFHFRSFSRAAQRSPLRSRLRSFFEAPTLVFFQSDARTSHRGAFPSPPPCLKTEPLYFASLTRFDSLLSLPPRSEMMTELFRTSTTLFSGCAPSRSVSTSRLLFFFHIFQRNAFFYQLTCSAPLLISPFASLGSLTFE